MTGLTYMIFTTKTIKASGNAMVQFQLDLGLNQNS